MQQQSSTNLEENSLDIDSRKEKSEKKMIKGLLTTILKLKEYSDES